MYILKIALTLFALVSITATCVSGPLHHAARQGKVELVNQLLSQGGDPNERDEQGWTPLHHAVAQGRVAVVDALLAGGADIGMRLPEEGPTSYELAMQKSRPAIAVLLGQRSFTQGLGNVAAFPQLFTELHQSLIKSEKVQNEYHQKEVEKLQQVVAALEDLVKGALPGAAITGDQVLFRKCREAGLSLAITNDQGLNVLHIGCMNGRLEFIILLLDYEMDVNALVEREGNYCGWTPLHCACLQDNLAVVKTLLDRGALPTSKNAQGQQPIKVALAAKKNQAIIDLLLPFEVEEKRQYRAIPCTHKHELASPDSVKICPQCHKDVKKWVQFFS